MRLNSYLGKIVSKMGTARCGTTLNEKPEMQRRRLRRHGIVLHGERWRRGHRAAAHTVVAVLSLITVHGGNRSGGLE
jgi:hypothetical protein